MTDYNQEKPSIEDLMNSKKVKVTVLILLGMAIILAQLDLMGLFG